jgi:hypothetical protein
MKYLFILLLMFSFSCEEKRQTTPVAVENSLSDFEVRFLFSKDKCSIYRFYDKGEYRYFTDCTETMSRHCRQVGKIRTCRQENIGNK